MNLPSTHQDRLRAKLPDSDREIAHHERALAGMAITDPSVIDRSEIDVAGHNWIDPVSNVVWPILCGMRRRAEPIGDAAAIIANIGDRLDALGGLAEMRRLQFDAGLVNQDAYHRAKIVDAMERSRLRRLGALLIERSADRNITPDQIREWITNEAYAMPQTVTQDNSAARYMRDVIELSRSKKPTAKVTTGLIDLDATIGGFRPGQLIILAARPSVGKSALAGQFGIDASKEGFETLFVSLEMTATETVSRALSYETGIPIQSILDGSMTANELYYAEGIAKSYESIPLRIEDRRGLTIDRLSSLIRQQASSRKLGLVIVDYLGLIVGDRRKPRWESVTEISNRLKEIAGTENIPLLALCQLNREAEGQPPKLSDLRESGSIEQDADVVLLLHREKRNSTEAELFVAKQRNGPIKKMKLEYTPDRLRFRTWVGGVTNDFSSFSGEQRNTLCPKQS